MKLRVARHTADLPAIAHFYTEILGLQVLGSFTGHDGYDGVFIGKPNADWHLEFTVSACAPAHLPDEDDLLVFYTESMAAFDLIVNKLNSAGITDVIPKTHIGN